jgi:hypothetical protein
MSGSPNPSIPDDIKARQRQAAEQARLEQQRATKEREDRHRLAAAGNRVDDLGSDYELQQRADEGYLRGWVTAIAAYKAVSPSWPNREVPPAGLTEHRRDAWRVAVKVFLASDTAPQEAVDELKWVATIPDFAATMAQWLRRGLRQVCEDPWVDGRAVRPATAPVETPMTVTIPVETMKTAIDLIRKAEVALLAAAEKLNPAEGTRFAEEDVPAAYREGGKSDGAILTGPYLEDTSEWDLHRPYLSKNYGPGKTLTTHIKVGHAKAYLFTEVAALRVTKTAHDAGREEKG